MRESLLEKLREPRGDQEISHSVAEEFLVAYFVEAGDAELANAWRDAQREQGWWYA